MDELADVKKKIDVLRDRERQLEDYQFCKNTLPAYRANIGKTYVYRENLYSSKGKWDQFRKLVDVIEKEGCITAVFLECYIDSDGRPFLTHIHGYLNRYNNSIVENGWKDCLKQEFDGEIARVISALGLVATPPERKEAE